MTPNVKQQTVDLVEGLMDASKKFYFELLKSDIPVPHMISMLATSEGIKVIPGAVSCDEEKDHYKGLIRYAIKAEDAIAICVIMESWTVERPVKKYKPGKGKRPSECKDRQEAIVFAAKSDGFVKMTMFPVEKKGIQTTILEGKDFVDVTIPWLEGLLEGEEV